ncbi:adenylate cyclase [Frankia sp. AgB1.9]|uniref:adenylate cyclase n=1 Tax=unclassified Frankia TaxID=2632575 RepID=UPI001934A04B|nr:MULTISPECIES: adenylate cyclase [unclassified Frankia]MBL7494570.1 adenylate cyclase [Frankia sp. AgW1.1]MBL7551638.1 adenylate cyclase [Frankia sp. AgB1.9]MBL7624195.1 adenylate cyclase [Frankia sp. AgB1.8]
MRPKAPDRRARRGIVTAPPHLRRARPGRRTATEGDAMTGRKPVRAAQNFWQLPEDDLDGLLRLAPQADRVELKLLIPIDGHQETCDVLGIQFADAPAHRVYYLDTPDRRLHRRGVVARVRSIRHRPDDSVVKLRPVAPADVPSSLRRSKDFVVEIDGMPGSYVCSGALKSRLGSDDVESVMADRRPLHALFSARQRALLVPRLPGGVTIDDLMVFGPVDARRRKLTLDGFDRTLLAEQWTFPDRSQILELSTRCAPDEALKAAATTAAFLGTRGIDLTGPQQTKTLTTLKFFTAPAAAAPSATREPESRRRQRPRSLKRPRRR